MHVKLNVGKMNGPGLDKMYDVTLPRKTIATLTIQDKGRNKVFSVQCSHQLNSENVAAMRTQSAISLFSSKVIKLNLSQHLTTA